MSHKGVLKLILLFSNGFCLPCSLWRKTGKQCPVLCLWNTNVNKMLSYLLGITAKKANKSQLKLGPVSHLRTHMRPYAPCPTATAITPQLPDTDQVFENTPTLSEPWLPLKVKGAMCFQLCFQSPSVLKQRGENGSLTCIRVFLRPQWHEYLRGTGWMHVFLCQCVHVCSWMSVKKSKEGSKSWMQRGTTWGSPGVKRQEVSWAALKYPSGPFLTSLRVWY